MSEIQAIAVTLVGYKLALLAIGWLAADFPACAGGSTIDWSTANSAHGVAA